MDAKIALDNALTDIDEYITYYRRGLATLTNVSDKIMDTLLDLGLHNLHKLYAEIIPLCAEYIILDSYCVSQFKNVIRDWKINWRIGIYNFMQDIQKSSISDTEKLNYYKAYIVLNVYPEYGTEN